MGRIKHSLNENTLSFFPYYRPSIVVGKGDIAFDNYSIFVLFSSMPYTSHAFVFCAVSYASKKIMKPVNKLIPFLANVKKKKKKKLSNHL